MERNPFEELCILSFVCVFIFGHLIYSGNAAVASDGPTFQVPLGWTCLVISALCAQRWSRERVWPQVMVGLTNGCVLKTPGPETGHMQKQCGLLPLIFLQSSLLFASGSELTRYLPLKQGQE